MLLEFYDLVLDVGDGLNRFLSLIIIKLKTNKITDRLAVMFP